MINQDKIKVIAFDLGNVLLPFSRWKAVFNIARISKKNPFAIALWFLLFGQWQDFDRGKYTTTEFYEVVKKGLKFKISEEEFSDAFADMFRENTQVINLLPLLKQKFKLILLSDINPVHANFCINRYKFLNIFDKKILSYQVKVKKPAPEMFQILIREAEACPEEIIFIDDKAGNARGAERAGIHGLHFKSEKQLLNFFTQNKLLTSLK